MNFPKRIKQHKSQSDSFAILLYRLKDIGIFRNVTENDYGIDFEIEFVHNDELIGKYLKAQVKSAEEVYVRNDGVPTVSGIKQSTLLYWTELSFRTHVVVFAVDLKTERIYFTKSIFWQATVLLDKSEKSKTIEFLPAIQLVSKDDSKTEKEIEKFENTISGLNVKKIAYESSISDIIYAHRTLLRNLKSVFELYADTWHYDAWTEVQQLDVFKTVLECSKILIGFDLPKEIDGLNNEERKNLFSFDYWARKTDWSWDDVSNQIAKMPLKVIYPTLLDKIQFYSNLILEASHYWIYKDRAYLKLVHFTKIPTSRKHSELFAVDYNYNDFENEEHFPY
ncbi:DUF4365 domain-containing protein [Winogradskyella forsetii]|uniref:DUF4365 domain-containing protein n=1 Tax=Winogradskyella forsetii TaxID=2686077 RepID=UPI0015BE5971|nr:DUF4365 domain-containing protein [Winogradskyella forsetii]